MPYNSQKNRVHNRSYLTSLLNPPNLCYSPSYHVRYDIFHTHSILLVLHLLSVLFSYSTSPGYWLNGCVHNLRVDKKKLFYNFKTVQIFRYCYPDDFTDTFYTSYITKRFKFFYKRWLNPYFQYRTFFIVNFFLHAINNCKNCANKIKLP